MDNRCPICGCFLACEEISTEAGYQLHFYCNNKKCKSNTDDNTKELVRSVGGLDYI